MVKNKKIILLILSIVCTAFIGLGVFWVLPPTSVKAEPLPAEQYTQPGTYVLDSVFELPKRSYTLNEETKEAKTVLVSPSEIAYDGSQVALNETGVWTLEFSVMFDKLYVFTEEFTVNRYTYEVTSGSITVGTSSLFPESGEGLVIQLEKDAEFRYNEVIDLRGMTAAENVIEFGLMPSAVGITQVSTVYITLTDIYDTNNYVRIIAHNPNVKDTNAYPGRGTLAATFTGQDVWLGHQQVYTDGRHYIQSKSPYYGTYTKLSFDGYKHSMDKGSDSICQIGYDYADMAVHSKTKGWVGSATGKYTTLVADLDDLDYTNTKLSSTGTGKGFSDAFKGFTTGEVYLSISCEGYSSNTCGLFIKSICDADFSQVKSYDYAAPILTIDTEGYDVEALPLAEVGSAYEIFDAVALDNETVIQPDIKVYYMRGSSRLSRVSVANNAFIPTIAGKYCIEYTAVDGSGNQTSKTLYINAVEDVALPEIELVGDYDKEAFVGETVKLANVESVAYSGNTSLSIKVVFNGQGVVEKSNTFVAEREGTYTVDYVVKDYIGQEKMETYSIVVVKSQNPIIVNEPVLPNAFIDGATYSLPIIFAKDYTTETVKDVVSKISVTDGDGTRELSDGVFTASAGNMAHVSVRYEFISASGMSELEYEIPLVKISNLENDLIKYFVPSSACEVSQQKNAVLLSYTESCFVNYIKPIPLVNTRFIFHIHKDGDVLYDNGNGIEVVLTDIENKNKQIKISLTADEESGGEYYYASVNNGRKYMINGDFYNDAQLDFYYNNTNRYVKVGSTVIYLDEVLGDEQFSGFVNEQAYLSIRGLGVDKTLNKPFGVEVVKIDDQSFAKTDGDYIPPVIVIQGETESKYSYGETVQTFTAFGVDMLQENVSCTLTVTDPSGEVVCDINNKALSNVPANIAYTLKLEQYGNFRVRYTATDSVGRKTSRNLLYYVSDMELPTITVSGKYFKCKVNNEITLPSITISDNVTSIDNLVCYVMYKDPNGRTRLIEDVVKDGNTVSAKFQFNQVGEWTITYLVYDENFNVTMYDIFVVVEE